eukprot:2907322-Amphidinium_carterae.1
MQMLQDKLSIPQTSFVKGLVGSQLLAPPTATMKEQKAHFAWKDDEPIELTVVAGELKVRRHIYNFRGGAPPYRGLHLTATEEILLDPSVAIAEQLHLCLPPQVLPVPDEPEDEDVPRYFLGIMEATQEPPQ